MIRLRVDGDRLAADTVVVTREDHRYLSRVLRLTRGDIVTLFDGAGGEADAEILRIGPRAAELWIRSRRHVQRTGPRFVLLQALVKGEKLALVVQKATELGVHEIIPVTSARTVVHLETSRAAARLERWQRIAQEASRQSGRADVPRIAAVTSFATAITSLPAAALKLLFWEEARSRRLKDALPAETPDTVVLAIGPEGGFSHAEAQQARTAGFATVGLGATILRTETAAVAALAVLRFALGQMD